MVGQAFTAAHQCRKPVTICGEMAARPDLAAALVVLGADALSVAATAIPELKRALVMMHIGPLATQIDRVLACADGLAVHAALRALVPDPG